jgi:kojibiose phosphorylase
MARRNLQLALKALEWLHKHAPENAAELEQQLDLTPERLNSWRDIAAHIRVTERGLMEQFDRFFALEELDQKVFAGRTDSYQGIIGVKEIQAYRIIKQADVLMLLTVLKQEFDLETKRVNWNYYYPITDHDYGSSLTPALHVILGCELGHIDVAYELFMKGALVDLENLRGNTPEGIHAACAGAVWQAIVLGFAGLKVTEDDHTVTPHLPPHWTRLAFNFFHKGELVNVDIRKP